MLRGGGKFDQIQVNSSKFSPQILNFITSNGKTALLRQPGDMTCQCPKRPEMERRVKPSQTQSNHKSRFDDNGLTAQNPWKAPFGSALWQVPGCRRRLDFVRGMGDVGGRQNERKLLLWQFKQLI
jgi:hypothetical protein